jgi:hypothetical protein
MRSKKKSESPDPETPKIHEHRVPIRDPDERFAMDQDERKHAEDTSHAGASTPDVDGERNLSRGPDADAEELGDEDIIEATEIDDDVKYGEGPDA